MTALNEARVAPIGRLVGAVSRVRVPWWLFSRVAVRLLKAPLPPEGWAVTWRETSERRFAFDVHRCVYQRTFEDCGHPELAPMACRSDDILFARLPGARFVRESTLARGAPRCDFSFERVTANDGRAPGRGGGLSRTRPPGG